jgi:hypothetical protein
MDDEDQLQGASSTSNEYQSWISNADTLRHEETVREVMTAKLEAITRGIGDIKINENYACFFTTRQGHMGLGPRDMRDDDQVCILRGCNFPVVLRQYGFSFKLVGAAYVAGFMYGEFLRSRWATGVRRRSLRLFERHERWLMIDYE